MAVVYYQVSSDFTDSTLPALLCRQSSVFLYPHAVVILEPILKALILVAFVPLAIVFFVVLVASLVLFANARLTTRVAATPSLCIEVKLRFVFAFLASTTYFVGHVLKIGS
jgi:hypothetical protein